MCGNVTLLGRLEASEKSALPERARGLLESMLRVSQMRGAQAGGAAVQVEHAFAPRQLLRKCVNPKRGDLAARLSQLVGRAARGKRAYDGTFLVQAHVRFATAGASSKAEAHPFHFLGSNQHAPRCVFRALARGPEVSRRGVETALSHNGDMDALTFRGVRLPYRVLGFFLERVLSTTNRLQGDSPTLAGSIELFLTQGMWLESLRLAYQKFVAPPPPDLSSAALPVAGEQRARALRAAFARHLAPTRTTLEGWAELAEQALAESHCRGNLHEGEARRRVAETLADKLQVGALRGIGADCMAAFARAALDAFCDNDLYHAVRELEPCLEGTFGCVVTSSLEPGRVVALTRGQPLSIGLDDERGLAGIVSERAALKVRRLDGEPAFSKRLDLDLGAGEIARLEFGAGNAASLSVYNIAERRDATRRELEASGRLVSLAESPYVSPAPRETRDRASRDIRDIAPVLNAVRRSFEEPQSFNRQTAQAFADVLLRRPEPRLLVVGITNDLWLAEQFVQNLKTIFPGLRAEAKSSNLLLKDYEELPIDEHTTVLAVSQSGQDFPTLASLLLAKQALARHDGSSLFVLTSELDTLMGQFAGQGFAAGAPFCRRIFTNHSGFRPSEAALLSVNATQSTFNELLLFLAAYALDRDAFHSAPLGFALTRRELDVLRRRRDWTVDRHVPRVTDKLGSGAENRVLRELSQRMRRFSWHVLEGAVAFAVALLVLEVNFQFGLGIEPSRLLELVPRTAGAHPAWRVLDVMSTQVNVLFYAFLAPLIVWLLRFSQGRPALHRQGIRELLIGDTRYVHQIVWFLARRLFSLSYGFATIKPYSADSQDDLVLTHEPVRGTLGLFGIPDGRRRHLAVRAAAASMTAKQFVNSRSIGGAGAEIVTIGHGTAIAEAGPLHLALPSGQPESSSRDLDLLVENMFDSWDRLLAMQMFLNGLSERVSKFWLFGYDRSRTKDQVFAPTTAAPVSAAIVYELLARGSARFSRVRAPISGTRPSFLRATIGAAGAGNTLLGMPAPKLGDVVPTSNALQVA